MMTRLRRTRHRSRRSSQWNEPTRSLNAKVLGVATVLLILAAPCISNAQFQAPFRIFTRPARPYNNVTALAFSPDSERLLAGSALGGIAVIDVQTGATINSFDGMRFLSRLAMDPHGKVLIGMRTGFEDIARWRVSDWTQLSSLRTPDYAEVRSIALSPDGKMLAAGCDDMAVYLWDVPAQNLRAKLRGHLGPVDSLAFSPDGAVLASASWHETQGCPVVLWDTAIGERVRVIVAHPRLTTCIAFLPGGQQLVTTGMDQKPPDDDTTIKVWDVASRQLVQTLRGHTNSVKAMVPLPEGKLISGGHDRTVRLWDLVTRRELRRIAVRHLVSTLVLSPDGKYLACGMTSSEGKYELWRLSSIFPEAVKARDATEENIGN